MPRKKKVEPKKNELVDAVSLQFPKPKVGKPFMLMRNRARAINKKLENN